MAVEVKVDVRDIFGDTAHGDAVRVWSPSVREGVDGLINSRPQTVPLADGKATLTLEPGPVNVQILPVGAAGKTKFEGTVPDTGPVTLREVVGGSFTYTPAVVSAAQKAAREARESVEKVEGIITRFGDMDTAITKAGDSATAAKTSETNAAASATAAKASQTASKTSETNAASSATAAKASETAAKASQTAAKTSETNSKTSQTAAKTSETNAAASATAASNSASNAAASALEAGNIAENTFWEGDKLNVNGKTSPSLTGPPGSSGTWDNITGKPDTFPPSTHTHPVGQIDGLDEVLEDKPGTDVVAMMISQAVAGLVEGAPKALDTIYELAAYLTDDTVAGGLVQQLAGKANNSDITTLQTGLNSKASKVEMNQRPALFSGNGAPPASIPGAVVGDWWLNQSTMELHKITGV